MVGFAVERLTELKVCGPAGAAHREKSPERPVQRNIYRDGDWQARASAVDLRTCK